MTGRCPIHYECAYKDETGGEGAAASGVDADSIPVDLHETRTTATTNGSRHRGRSHRPKETMTEDGRHARPHAETLQEHGAAIVPPRVLYGSEAHQCELIVA